MLFSYFPTVLLVIDIQFSLGYDVAVENIIPCRQSRFNTTYDIDCSNLNLKSVPKCKSLNVTDCKLITQMNLNNNKIELIRNGSFTSFPNLVFLQLGDNPIQKFENAGFAGLERLESLTLIWIESARGKKGIFSTDTFVPLINLKLLDLSYSFLDIQHVFENVLCGVTSSIETLLMDHVFHFNAESSFVVLNSKMSKCFGHMRLKKLSLHHNKIVEITSEFFSNLRHLEHLSLRYNNILGDRGAIFSFLFIHKLTFLDMGCQSTWQCEEYVYPANIPNFQDDNLLQSYPFKSNGSEMQFLPNLHTFRLDRVGAIGGQVEIPDICWSNNHLVELDLSYTHAESISGTFKCLWNLKFLNLSGCRLSYLDPMIFHDMISLKVLLLKDTFFSRMILAKDSSKMFFKNNKELKYLELSHNEIDVLHKGVFENLNALSFLNLSHNQIKHVDDQFERLTSLEHVDISYNALTGIPTRLLSVLERNMKINPSIKGNIHMVGNPFQCSCTLMSEITRIQMSTFRLISLNSNHDNLFCLLQNGTRIPFSKVRKQLSSSCHVSYELTPVVFLTFVYPFCLIVISLSTCGYRYRWWVKYAWYTVLHLFYKKEQERTDFTFDAFISYCSEDEDWVRRKLVANLEQENNKYNLCLHYRHFLPGRNITDNIVAAVQRSRKTVLVVTKKYLRSGWCDFETRYAHTHHLHEHTGGVIGIIHPEVFHVRGKCGTVLDKLIDSVTYIKWPVEKETEGLFLLRLKKALGPPMRRRAPSDDTYNLLVL